MLRLEEADIVELDMVVPLLFVGGLYMTVVKSLRKTTVRCRFFSMESIQRPGGAIWACQHGIGFCIVDEAFVNGIPIQRSAESHGDVCEMAARDGTVSDFGGADRLSACADTVEEILYMVFGFIESDV